LFDGTIPEDSIIETDINNIGRIQGGASLEYKPKFYECSDDLGLVSREILTEEEISLKSGVMTWNGNTLQKLCSTARVTEDLEKHTRTVKIGGINNFDAKKYLIRFVNKDKLYGNTRITIVGSNQAGFSMAFAKDKETVVNAEFKAGVCDKEGTKIIYTEDTKAATV